MNMLDGEGHIEEEWLLVLASEGIAAISASEHAAIHRHLDVCRQCSELLGTLSCGVHSTQQALPSGPPRLLQSGELLAGRYRVARYIASGGMGEVYEVEDEMLDGRRLALKCLAPSLSDDEVAVRRMAREVALAREISHRNVCRVHHFESHRFADRRGTLHFLTMELVEGEALSERLRRSGPLDEGEAKQLALQLLDALEAAHDKGVLHRDIKCSNVMLRAGSGDARSIDVALMDFGLAKGVGREATQITRDSAAFVATPAYASPEQITGGPLTSATDLYSMGVLLFEALTGRLPFEAEGALPTAVARLQRAAPRPRQLRSDLHADWDEFIGQCLERNPSRRPASARALKRRLESLGARPIRSGRLFLAFGLGASLLAGAALWMNGSEGPEDSRGPATRTRPLGSALDGGLRPRVGAGKEKKQGRPVSVPQRPSVRRPRSARSRRPSLRLDMNDF